MIKIKLPILPLWKTVEKKLTRNYNVFFSKLTYFTVHTNLITPKVFSSNYRY